MQERIQELQWKLLENPPYSPELASSDFHLFGPLKTTFVANVQLMRLKRRCGTGRDTSKKKCYAPGFHELVKRWGNVSMSVENISRNVFFSQVRTSHVLRFIFVTYLLNLPHNATEPV
jgi:hypothetical protein